MITQESIEALKARLDIVDVVGSAIELKKAGANFKALCPFHDEKTPSFVVSPQKQIYHCFSCGAGGDSIKFVMEHEKLNYPEALEKLASTYNFSLSYTDNKQKKFDLHILDKINKWYQSLLISNQNALSYLKQRGIYESSIEKFGIGYAPESQATLNYISSQSLNMKDALDTGVIGFDSGRSYARFIQRITFPIHSTNGSVVGFGGRTITGHQAKYVNSPETAFFNKSKLLYAYHHARQSIYKQNEIIITEGYLDVIMLHQAGFINAVATLGTALTSEHLPLLRRGEPKVIMAYDGDNAGKSAALKASKLLSAAGFNGGVVLFGDGLDPADMVQQGSIKELASMFRSPKPFIEFVLDEILASYNLKDPKAKEACMQDGIGYLKTLSPILQEEYKTYLASRLGGLGVSPSLVKLNTQNNSQEVLPKQNRHRDIWELSLIKTVLEYPKYVNQILDVLDPSILQFHSHELSLALNPQQRNSPELMSILVDDKIISLKDEESLKAELITFLTKHYERELKKIQLQKDIVPFEKKAFLIRKYRDKIMLLKKGQLVAFKE